MPYENRVSRGREVKYLINRQSAPGPPYLPSSIGFVTHVGRRRPVGRRDHQILMLLDKPRQRVRSRIHSGDTNERPPHVERKFDPAAAVRHASMLSRSSRTKMLIPPRFIDGINGRSCRRNRKRPHREQLGRGFYGLTERLIPDDPPPH